MSLYQKSKNFLFQEFIHKNYQGINEENKKKLLAIKTEDILTYKEELEGLLKLIEQTTIILSKSPKSLSLKESLFKICREFEIDFFTLYLFNYKKTILEKKIHFGNEDLHKASIPIEEWITKSDNPLLSFSLYKNSKKKPILEQKTILENYKGNQIGGVIWKKKLSHYSLPVIRNFLKSMTVFCINNFK